MLDLIFENRILQVPLADRETAHKICPLKTIVIYIRNSAYFIVYKTYKLTVLLD